ncbi:MAG: NYN domain-containing protein [Chloroflexi bacterium]|nr:NYN domain-containing protein [Chloroflexota bacterium]
MKSERVIAYVDGFNLYFGLKEKGWRCYYWLNVKLLCQNLLISPQHLIVVKYFTSRITSPPDKRKRQSIFLEALNTVDGIKPYYGKYQLTPLMCEKCGHQNDIPEEKMTDVQITSEMVSDAHRNKYDTALLVSADRDLVPSIEKVRSEFPHKHVIVVFPPMRTNDDLRRVANGFVHITEPLLKKSLLPPEITKLDGYVLKCPLQWH